MFWTNGRFIGENGKDWEQNGTKKMFKDQNGIHSIGRGPKKA